MILHSLLQKIELFIKFSGISAFVLSENSELVYCSYGEKKLQGISIFEHVQTVEFDSAKPKILVFNGLEVYGLFKHALKDHEYRFVFGPVLTAKPMSEVNIMLLSFSELFDMETVKKFMKSIPLMTVAKFVQFMELVFYVVCDRHSSFDEISQNRIAVETKPIFGSKFTTDQKTIIGCVNLLPDHDEIMTICEYVKQGDIENIPKNLDNSIFLRQFMSGGKNDDFIRFIASTTLLAKCVTEVGIPFEDSLSIAMSFIKYAEDVESNDDFLILLKTMIQAYTTRVYEENNRKQYPLPVKRAISYIENHLHYPITLENVAKHVNLSRAYFSQLFATKTGVPLQKYIKTLKVQEAEDSLKYSKQSIGEISDTLAFCSQSYFTEVFKEIRHTTPVAYRKKHRLIT